MDSSSKQPDVAAHDSDPVDKLLSEFPVSQDELTNFFKERLKETSKVVKIDKKTVRLNFAKVYAICYNEQEDKDISFEQAALLMFPKVRELSKAAGQLESVYQLLKETQPFSFFEGGLGLSIKRHPNTGDDEDVHHISKKKRLVKDPSPSKSKEDNTSMTLSIKKWFYGHAAAVLKWILQQNKSVSETFERKDQNLQRKVPNLERKVKSLERKVKSLERNVQNLETTHPSLEPEDPTLKPNDPTPEQKERTPEQKEKTLEGKIQSLEGKVERLEKKVQRIQEKNEALDHIKRKYRE